MVQSRASGGSVTVEEVRGKLRLHLPRSVYGGKNKYLSLGLDDTPGNR
jgi:integrase